MYSHIVSQNFYTFDNNGSNVPTYFSPFQISSGFKSIMGTDKMKARVAINIADSYFSYDRLNLDSSASDADDFDNLNQAVTAKLKILL